MCGSRVPLTPTFSTAAARVVTARTRAACIPRYPLLVACMRRVHCVRVRVRALGVSGGNAFTCINGVSLTPARSPPRPRVYCCTMPFTIHRPVVFCARASRRTRPCMCWRRPSQPHVLRRGLACGSACTRAAFFPCCSTVCVQKTHANSHLPARRRGCAGAEECALVHHACAHIHSKLSF